MYYDVHISLFAMYSIIVFISDWLLYMHTYMYYSVHISLVAMYT